ncbi:hypothetical protein ABW20_dc0104017 [Dactylellina cionopaga]|nr:hypothetical protein ABW20_dc0104017 [Dactylellina cionopaga]
MKLLGQPLVISTNDLIPEFSGVPGLRTLSTNEIESQQLEKPGEALEFPGISKTENDLAVLMLTSGSTSNPKAVCLKNGQLLASMKSKSAGHGTNHNDVFLNWIGLDHVANLTQIHLHAMSLAAQQVHVPAAELMANPLGFLGYISSHKVTYTLAPNFFLATLVRSLESLDRALAGSNAPADGSSASSVATSKNPLHGLEDPESKFSLASLRVLASGGEANVVSTCDKLTRLLRKYNAPSSFISPGFGMTETCAGSIHSTLDCPAYDLGLGSEFCSVGTPMPGIEMRIIRRDGTIADVNEVGSLEVSGPVVFSGYYNDTKASCDAITPDGWFKTGDLGAIDFNGRLRLTGRDKDEVAINGINYPCASIETAIELAGIPEITPSFTVVWSYRPKNAATESFCVAYLPVNTKADAHSRSMTASAISKAVVKNCGARPLKIMALPENLLQKSSLGKLSRSKIKKAFADGAFSQYEDIQEKPTNGTLGGTGEGAKTVTEEVILKVFGDLLRSDDSEPAVEVRINTDMLEIGISSIDMMRLRVYLQKALEIEIPVVIFFSNPTIRSLGRAIDDLRKEKEYDPITVLQPNGTKTPLFMIHPGLGEVLIFANLARYFEDRPVYAIRSRGFDGEPYFTSIEEIVDTYYKAIKRVQPAGPYAIMGLAWGSVIGFEIIKRLEANNDKAPFFGAIDQPPHVKLWARAVNWAFTAFTIGYYTGLFDQDYRRITVPLLKDKTPDEILDHIVERRGAQMKEIGLSREHLKNWTTLAYHLTTLSRNYDPQGQVATIDIFHTCYEELSGAQLKREWPIEDIMAWKELAEDSRTCIYQGSEQIRPPHVAGFYKRLNKAIEERGL